MTTHRTLDGRFLVGSQPMDSAKMIEHLINVLRAQGLNVDVYEEGSHDIKFYVKSTEENMKPHVIEVRKLNRGWLLTKRFKDTVGIVCGHRETTVELAEQTLRDVLQDIAMAHESSSLANHVNDFKYDDEKKELVKREPLYARAWDDLQQVVSGLIGDNRYTQEEIQTLMNEIVDRRRLPAVPIIRTPNREENK